MTERVVADESVLLRKHIMLALGELMGFVYTHTHTHILPPIVPLDVSPFHFVSFPPSLSLGMKTGQWTKRWRSN